MSDEITLLEQIEAVSRARTHLERIYPRWVGEGKITQEKAERELRGLVAAYATLNEIYSRDVPTLF